MVLCKQKARKINVMIANLFSKYIGNIRVLCIYLITQIINIKNINYNSNV